VKKVNGQNSDKTTVAIIAAVLAIIIALVGYGYYQYSIQDQSSSIRDDINQLNTPIDTKEVEKEESTTIEPVAGEAGFSESGTLLDKDHVTETKGWTLMYEKPGMVILTAKLKFNNASVCDWGNGPEKCDESKFVIGDIINVKGNKVGDDLVVTEMKITKMQ